jgi:hypothetical protein
MFLILILVLIILFFLTRNTESFSSGGTNIQLNSNDASPTETTLTQYRPYWLPTFYQQDNVPTSELDYAKTISDDFNQNFDVNGNHYGVINENFNCNKWRKYNKNRFYNVNDYIVSNDYEQLRI